MRLVKPIVLAITYLRDQFTRLTLCSILLFSSTAQAEQILNILTQTQRLDAGLVQEFESTRKVSVRVEFVSSSLDYEARIRSLPNNWDLVLADEQRLVHLSLVKVLKPLPEVIAVPPDSQGLERRARANQDGRSYLNLMADPLGLMYLRETLTAAAPMSWEGVVAPVVNPLWRSRLALFADERMNTMAAAAATGVKFPVEQVDDARPAQAWLAQAQLQGRPLSLDAMIPAFLAEKYVVALAWQSEFLHASRYVKKLSFVVPQPSTYVERVGVGLVADCRNESLALDFIRFLYEKREQLAQKRGFLPLSVQQLQSVPVAGWRIFADDLPRLRELSTALGKLRKEKDARSKSR
ncbi:MAG: hypothetical protein RLZZ488_131 [Pseudomonadota bacterium]